MYSLSYDDKKQHLYNNPFTTCTISIGAYTFVEYIIMDIKRRNEMDSNTYHIYLITTLNSPIIVGHTNLLQSMLILIMRINTSHINFQPT